MALWSFLNELYLELYLEKFQLERFLALSIVPIVFQIHTKLSCDHSLKFKVWTPTGYSAWITAS